MKYGSECKKFKELANEAIDAVISAESKAALDSHVELCADCRKYLENMAKIRKTLLIQAEAPDFLETRVMAGIDSIDAKPEKAFNLRPVFGAAFGLVLLVSLLIIYKDFDNKTVIVADMPKTETIKTAKQPVLESKVQPVLAENKVEIKAENKETINSPVPAYEEHGPAINLASSNNQTEAAAPRDNTVKTGESSGLVMLKPGVIPTSTDNPLLDRDLAIVANNLINPLMGQFAKITIKVVDPANVKILIYDKNIRPISKILDSYKERGTYEATWEGRTDSGEVVSEGVYFVYIQIGTRVIKKSIIVNK